MSGFYPLNIVLSEQLLIAGESFFVHLGISPTVEDISAFSGIPTNMAGGFFGCGAVVNDVDLVHASA